MEENEKLRGSGDGGESARVLEFGLQPLDPIMRQYELTNTDVVNAMPALHLTHKMVAKARRGRRLTQRVQRKVTEAVNAALTEKSEKGESISYRHRDLFNYDGG